MLLLLWARARTRAPMHRLALVALAMGALACGEHLTSPSRGKIAIASGDAQRGAPGEPLGLPIVIVVRDPAGNPAADVRVSWVPEDGGAISPAKGSTDATGSASATWTLGGDRAMHHGHAVADGYESVAFTASTTIDPELPLDVIQPLVLSTYEGSGQTVHPDYVATGPAWPQSPRYLFITPYPTGNPAFENPSVYESADLLRWAAPLGLTNPVAPPTTGYNSDPDAVFVPELNELWLYFRQVAVENVVRLTKSNDGVHWSAPIAVARAPNHELISPSVVRRGPNDWLMWAVNGNVGCSGATATVELRRSTNGIDWSKPDAVVLSQGNVYPWHIDVEWLPTRGEYWAMYNTKTAGTCTTSALYLATSRDGVHWTTYPSPVLARGAIPELRVVVYRSSFAYDELSDEVTIWYSGARLDAGNYIWRSAVQRRRRTDLFTTINSATKLAAPTADRVLPALTNFP
jgi:hypothetical protein